MDCTPTLDTPRLTLTPLQLADATAYQIGTVKADAGEDYLLAHTLATVAVAKVTREDLAHDIVLTAEFKPYQEVDVMAKEAGYIKSIRVDIGDRVKAGQLLAELEIPEMQDDMARAAASV